MTKSNKVQSGYISAINGSLLEIKGLENYIRLHDLIKIEKRNILGECIQIHLDHVVVQCFENTHNLKLNEVVVNLEEPLSMELAPGLLSNVFDGIQRPLEVAFNNFKDGKLERGIEFPSLSRTRKWHFFPSKKRGDEIQGGEIIGIVPETPSIDHKILVPPGVSGKLTFLAKEGDYTIEEEIYKVKSNDKINAYSMLQKWPITQSRPYQEKILSSAPLITGLRVIDLLFPVAKGGTVAIPGGFGTGKTVIQQSLAKWCDADMIVFIGCGEPGSEIANILKQFSETIDPKSGRPILEHIVLIANTSNMPTSAREASLFSGVTIAEYYRDMGYDVALLADSTSRWAESLREISGLLEEMPAEEGYPAYLPSKLSSFYERAGVVSTLEGKTMGRKRTGSITIIASISPPAGDFNEPVTTATKRVVQGFWALDSNLAYLKHYPAINWINSYSNYPEYISKWWVEQDLEWTDINIDWFECRKQVNEILSRENDLKYITQLLGEGNLPEDQKFDLFVAHLIRNGFLIQNAYDEIDGYTDTKKLIALVKIILLLYTEGKEFIKRGFIIEENRYNKVVNKLLGITRSVPNNDIYKIESFKNKLIDKLLKSMFIVRKKK
jgi:V/A-type H+-transporting ATPase subunit A